MFFLFYSVLVASGNVTEYRYEQFLENVLFGGKHDIDTYKKQYYIQLRQPADRDMSNYSYYIVYADANQYQLFSKIATPVNETSGDDVIYVQLEQSKPKPPISLVGNFWFPFFSCMFAGLSLFAAYILWVKDDYTNAPENSLIFATEGQKLVSGN